jgi:hypothetical protein
MTTSRATEEAMAKDETQDNTREWVWLSVYVDRTTDEVLSPELANQIVCDRLGSKQIPYRYLDSKGRPHHDNLTDRFWRKAVIDLATSSAVQPAEDYDYEQVDLGFEEFGHVSEAAVKVYRIEVLVPRQECAAVPAPAEVAIDPFKTGAAGRPSAAKVLCAEAERRIAEHDISQDTLKAFAASMLAWLYKTHPEAPNTSQKNAETILRSLWHSWKSVREKPGN